MAIKRLNKKQELELFSFEIKGMTFEKEAFSEGAALSLIKLDLKEIIAEIDRELTPAETESSEPKIVITDFKKQVREPLPVIPAVPDIKTQKLSEPAIPESPDFGVFREVVDTDEV